MNSTWIKHAISEINADYQRSADTHLIRLALPAFPGIQLYLKDESTHPTGSLKHRLARSLFLYGLCNGWIKEGTTIIESSSGSTAVSEAYFARLLGLPFIAVMPSCTAKRKIEQIEFYGGRCHFVESACEIYAASEKLARELNGHYMDQFTYAERATDWRGNNNIADSIFRQMSHEPNPVPAWVVMSGRHRRHLSHYRSLHPLPGLRDPTGWWLIPKTRCLWITGSSATPACAAPSAVKLKVLAARVSNRHSFRTWSIA
ncbi:O-phosphoserine sulfhydrylase [Kluyvera cryocrescens]|uniref:O-phosphoserine sulfhydrylase n=1 Tax=Kluyvera cryocrescens TaxID=580 RepID=A0A485CZW9_KLUCR|nr:O-phosphoserine sulfhydrylase [Kluyvera cryocrescens]